MRSLLGGGVIGTALGGMALAVMLLRRRGASSQVASRIAPPNRRREDLEELAKEELYARARQANVTGRSKMTKAGLITALRATS